MDMKKREFFKTLSKYGNNKEHEERPVRLPYNQDPSLFETVCIECGSKPCAGVCDENIIKILDDGTPALDFAQRGCTYCDECAKACDKGVLDLNLEPRDIRAKVTLDISTCIAWHKVICSSCADVCYDRAIKFLGMLRPEIVYENCTNCGFCIGVCPAGSISVKAEGKLI